MRWDVSAGEDIEELGDLDIAAIQTAANVYGNNAYHWTRTKEAQESILRTGLGIPGQYSLDDHEAAAAYTELTAATRRKLLREHGDDPHAVVADSYAVEKAFKKDNPRYSRVWVSGDPRKSAEGRKAAGDYGPYGVRIRFEDWLADTDAWGLAVEDYAYGMGLTFEGPIPPQYLEPVEFRGELKMMNPSSLNGLSRSARVHAELGALFQRSPRRGLGAITGERVEYWLEPEVYGAAMNESPDYAAGACFPTTRQMLELRRNAQASPNWPAIRDRFNEFSRKVDAEVARLRSRGVTGPIPMCLYKTTLSQQPRRFRRDVPTHERFHADMRRLEYAFGIPEYSCSKYMAEMLKPALTQELLDFSTTHWCDGDDRKAVEEILAYMTSILKLSGGQSPDEFDAALDNLVEGMASYGASEALVNQYARVYGLVKRKYGTPLNVARAAFRVCPLSRKP